MLPVSGAPFELRAGEYRASIAGVGATLRALRHGERDLILPFDEDELRPAMRGALLAPWPNRTADGRYAFDGVHHQLAISEPATRNAIHGLVAWLAFAPVVQEPDRVVLRGVIEPQPGYPWRVRMLVSFVLTESGLIQGITAVNESGTPAPYGVGGHPYLLAGPGGASAIDAWRLEVPADRVLLSSADRMLPTGEARVRDHGAGGLDFRRSRVIGGAVLNHAFTDLDRRPDGLTAVRLTDENGTGAEVEWDDRCPWVQVYTADEAEGPEYRGAVAIEPMTCPPDALNSGIDLIAIPPGGSASVAWTIRGLGAVGIRHASMHGGDCGPETSGPESRGGPR
ncbi:aldose 1-epimerase family protein [Microbacterium tumbae]